jgi:LacI family transcriptional regulator
MAKQVADAVKKLGYQPNETARALRGGSTSTIGIVIPQIDNRFFSQAVDVFEGEARKRGCTVVLMAHQELLSQQADCLSTMKRYRVDGVVLSVAGGTTRKDISAILPDVPVVAFDRYISSDIDSVTIHNKEAARIAIEHLMRHGHQSITCISGNSTIYTYQERIAAYTEMMGKQKHRVSVLEASDDEQMRYIIGEMLMGSKPPSALLSLGNLPTSIILRAYEELGIPRKMHLPMISFDDFDFATLVDPSLTTMRQPVEALARYALNLLFRRIEKDTSLAVQNITLPAELVCRRSCGCN